ncbi:SseB family protein [Prescottella agglutinans]|uniref:SseB family protein n=1 Tax=Prescottella agglutinans TaxID=1644129 RepID=UPI001F4E87EE|nr:SseB family protein [Prescottella agglutinans]
MGGGCADLVAEIDAFYQGFGQPDALLEAFRQARLLVPLTAENRVWSSEIRELGWLPVFTSEHELARHTLARGEQTAARYHALFGWRIVEHVLPSFDRPTGVVVDAGGSRPMAFPPGLEPERS